VFNGVQTHFYWRRRGGEVSSFVSGVYLIYAKFFFVNIILIAIKTATATIFVERNHSLEPDSCSSA
jgi:hypothetical protein